MDDDDTDQILPQNHECPLTPPSWPSSHSLSSSSTPASVWSTSTGADGAASPLTPLDACVGRLSDRLYLCPPIFSLEFNKQCDVQPQSRIVAAHSPYLQEDHSDAISRRLRTTVHDDSYPPCLQCSIKGLPCDRAWPSCSRCSRNGDGALCLAQRPKYLGDDVCEGPITYTIYRTTESDEQWVAKEALENLLLDQLRVRTECQNWVLPDQCGPKDHFSIGELLTADEWKDVGHARGSATGCRWKERVLQLRYGVLDFGDDVDELGEEHV